MRGVDRRAGLLVQLPFLHRVGLLQGGYQLRRGFPHRIFGGIGPTRLLSKCTFCRSPNPPQRIVAPCARTEIAKHLPPPARPRLRQHTVVGHRVIQAVAQEPQVIQPFPGSPPSTRVHWPHCPEKQQQHLYQNDGVGSSHVHCCRRTPDRRTHKRQGPECHESAAADDPRARAKVDLIVEQSRPVFVGCPS